ncbi:MAG TPA: aspartate--tRNA ligase [Bacilli bacterium]|nr:aspartate--tRNA ligase [Bacilli bacterium]HPY38140.1 aspartate--tRNA ligase [Bacilli bacterium]
MERTCYNASLSINDVGREVTLLGWVSKRRNLGSLLFIDLRDRSGIIQVTVKDDVKVPDVRNEYVIEVKGRVAKKDVANPKLKTGEIEVIASAITIINEAATTPLIIDDDTDALEDVRLKYRYLDLRRPLMQEKLKIRAKIVRAAHEFLDDNDFIEVETPILTLSTPEGARDYVVPSRIHHGSFYALPQSPQLFKQLLMIGGLERYYQIARCFRDEDLRADRQPDFTQIDIETSFLDETQILTLMEGLLKKIFKDVINYDLKLPLRRLSYDEALNRFGSDKPDTRFGLELKDVKDLVSKTSFPLFNSSAHSKAIVIPNLAETTSRKNIDELQLEAKKFRLSSFIVLKVKDEHLEGSAAKFFAEEDGRALIQSLSAKHNDVIIIACSNSLANVCFGLGALRSRYARELGLIKPNTYDLLWVVDFPLFEKDQDSGKLSPLHHPFTRPTAATAEWLSSDPARVHASAYDIVINGYEAGGGSLRIYNQKMQKTIFEVLGFSQEDIKNKFGFFIDAFKYGTPPHGGIAFGLDRLTMILSGTDNIRDVIAFPKNLRASCPMTDAPSKIDQAQLDELGIKFVE